MSMLKDLKLVIVGCGSRLVLIPLTMISLAYFVGFEGAKLAIILAVFATPNAVSSYAMARNYEADYELAGEMVAASSIFSMVTMFLFIFSKIRSYAFNLFFVPITMFTPSIFSTSSGDIWA